MCLQVGMPADQAQYIHRVGRTARAGKQGQAILLLHDFEQFFLRSIAELPVEKIKANSVQVSCFGNTCGSPVAATESMSLPAMNLTYDQSP